MAVFGRGGEGEGGREGWEGGNVSYIVPSMSGEETKAWNEEERKFIRHRFGAL